MMRRPPRSTLFPYTPLSGSSKIGFPRHINPHTQQSQAKVRRLPRQSTIQRFCRLIVTAQHIVLTSQFRNVYDVTWVDRKSTRLNSSHLVISYAVFCLKKKKN